MCLPPLPTPYKSSPRQTSRIVRPPGEAQLNARISSEARYQADAFLSDLKYAGRPTYLYELLDVLLLNLNRPDFALQVRDLLDTTDIAL